MALKGSTPQSAVGTNKATVLDLFGTLELARSPLRPASCLGISGLCADSYDAT